MVCSVCGQPGHNASTCHKQTPDEEPAAGLAAVGKHTDERAQGHVPAGCDVVDAERDLKRPRLNEERHIPNTQPVHLPEDGDVNVDVVQVMNVISREVHRGLPILLKEAGIVNIELPLYEHPPLDIKKTVNKSEVSSYKEPWRKSRAILARLMWETSFRVKTFRGRCCASTEKIYSRFLSELRGSFSRRHSWAI
jgi:hypothetical protein